MLYPPEHDQTEIGEDNMDIISKHILNKQQETMKQLETLFKDLVEENDELKKRLDSWNKDSEIAELYSQIKKNKKLSVYIRTEKELAEEEYFRKLHDRRCHHALTYTFKGNGIGSFYTLECLSCGMSSEIVDYDNW